MTDKVKRSSYRVPNAPKHVDYPHHAGTLYDCPACEEICYCGFDGILELSCLSCSISIESGFVLQEEC